MTLTVADLKRHEPARTHPNIAPTHPSLFCPSCHVHYSANPGDYWAAKPDAPLMCEECDEPYVLARTVELVIPWAGHEATRAQLREIVTAAWEAHPTGAEEEAR